MYNKKILVAPSMLSADFAVISDEIKVMEAAGADMLHLDIMDGIFVPNISFGPKFVADIKKRTKLPLDVHLMITRPERYIAAFAQAGADYITVHYEATDVLGDTLKKIREKNVKCGVVISPDTKVSVLKKYLPVVDMVLLMSVYPGFSGQKFIPSSIPRLRELCEMVNKVNPSVLIEIDGGVTIENAEEIKAAGADILVAGSTVFSSPIPAHTIKLLKKCTLNDEKISIDG